MISICVLFVLSSLLGMILFRRSIGNIGPGAFLGVSFLVGTGVISGTLFLLSLLGSRWSSLTCTAGIAAAAAILWFCGGFVPRAHRSSAPTDALANCSFIPDLITAALVAGHAVFATLAPPPENDFLSIWGLKAKVFFLNGGIDWSFLTSPGNAFSHPDYPLLLPLNYDFAALIGRGWNDHLLGLLTTIFGAALILVLRSLFAESVGRFAAAIGTLALASAALIPWIGLAEGPLVAFLGSAILLLRRGIRLDCRFSVAVGATLFGLAACTKNEGLTLAAAAFVSLLLYRETRKWFWQLLPAVLIPLPWIMVRGYLHLQSDLFRGNVVQHILGRLREPGAVLTALGAQRVMSPILLAGIVLAIFIVRRRLAGEDRPLVLILVLQFLVCLATYLATANDVTWQIKWSWERVMTQIVVPLEILLVAGLLEKAEPLLPRTFARRQDTTSA